MNKKYSKKELDEILLSKKIDDFYFAILEIKNDNLTEEEMSELIDKSILVPDVEDKELSNEFDELMKNELARMIAGAVLKAFSNCGVARRMAILTMVDDEVYNVCRPGFIDLSKEKIIRFDKVTDYYKEDEIEFRIFTKEEDPDLEQDEVLMGFYDETAVCEYEKNNIQQNESEDLTLDFLIDAKDKPFTKRK